MTRDDIIRMALEAGFDPHDMSADFTCNVKDIELFAELVAASEREACAQEADAHASIEGIAQRIAKAIRARGEK